MGWLQRIFVGGVVFVVHTAWAESLTVKETGSLEALLPEQIQGWQRQGQDQIYTRRNLFDYMNGAGEIYLAYDFHTLLVREYAQESMPSLVAEVYQMSSSADAYGICSHDTEGEEVNLGQGGFYGLGLLRFWKNRFFVRLIGERETEETKAALLALGQNIVAAIPEEGEKPRLVACLPLPGLLPQSVHYFHRQVSLNCHYYLADTNLLNLSEKTEAVLARYQVDGRKVRLLLVRYPQPSGAQEAYQQFGRAYFPDRPPGGSPSRLEKGERGEWIGARWRDRFVILVFEASNKKVCQRLTAAVAKKVKEVFPWKRKTKAEKG